MFEDAVVGVGSYSNFAERLADHKLKINIKFEFTPAFFNDYLVEYSGNGNNYFASRKSHSSQFKIVIADADYTGSLFFNNKWESIKWDIVDPSLRNYLDDDNEAVEGLKKKKKINKGKKYDVLVKNYNFKNIPEETVCLNKRKCLPILRNNQNESKIIEIQASEDEIETIIDESESEEVVLSEIETETEEEGKKYGFGKSNIQNLEVEETDIYDFSSDEETSEEEEEEDKVNTTKQTNINSNQGLISSVYTSFKSSVLKLTRSPTKKSLQMKNKARKIRKPRKMTKIIRSTHRDKIKVLNNDKVEVVAGGNEVKVKEISILNEPKRRKKRNISKVNNVTKLNFRKARRVQTIQIKPTKKLSVEKLNSVFMSRSETIEEKVEEPTVPKIKRKKTVAELKQSLNQQFTKPTNMKPMRSRIRTISFENISIASNIELDEPMELEPSPSSEPRRFKRQVLLNESRNFELCVSNKTKVLERRNNIPNESRHFRRHYSLNDQQYFQRQPAQRSRNDDYIIHREELPRYYQRPGLPREPPIESSILEFPIKRIRHPKEDNEFKTCTACKVRKHEKNFSKSQAVGKKKKTRKCLICQVKIKEEFEKTQPNLEQIQNLINVAPKSSSSTAQPIPIIKSMPTTIPVQNPIKKISWEKSKSDFDAKLVKGSIMGSKKVCKMCKNELENVYFTKNQLKRNANNRTCKICQGC